MADELTPEQAFRVHEAIFAGNKIEAIKLYRGFAGKDLKDSKQAVEKMTAELEAADPARFAQRRRQAGSLATLAFWGAVAAAIAWLVFARG